MSRGDGPDLPLFDLPLQGDVEGEENGVETGEESRAAVGTPGQSRLFERGAAGSGEAAAEGGELSGSHDAEPHDAGSHDPDSHDPDSHDADFPEADLDESVGVLDRLLGGLIDLALHAVVLGAGVLGSWLMGARLGESDGPPFALFLLLFSLLYTAVPLAFWGQTPGMMRVGHVARTGDGEPLTFGQTVRRWLGALLTLALAGLPVLLALGGSRSLADRLSGSYTELA